YRPPQEAFGETLTSNQTCAQAGEPSVSIEESVVETCETRRDATVGALAVGSSEKSSADAKAAARQCESNSQERAEALQSAISAVVFSSVGERKKLSRAPTH